MQGLIHIYCGKGKGKTTAAMGLAIRAAGSGMRVHIVQLLKGAETSELRSLEKIDGITISRLKKNYGFASKMTDEQRAEVTEYHNKMLAEAAEMMNDLDMLIIDEFCGAYSHNMLDKDLARRIVFDRPSHLELVLTGRDPAPEYIEAADYVSEIKAVKHPFEKGIKARKGIEF
ncbi:MAG: cob(I)yrinic acid a,c-diamide adenosyltransferase [Huintestinicola sp.]